MDLDESEDAAMVCQTCFVNLVQVFEPTTLVVIDPFAGFIGKVDSHNNSAVRSLLTPLSKLAKKYGVTILGINHLNKGSGDNAMYRGMGSIAFVAAARSSWLVAKDPNNPEDRRLFTRVKNNLAGEDVGGLAYRVGKAYGGISWEKGKVATTADQALRVPDPEKAPARSSAKEWLQQLLKDGPVPSKDVWGEAESLRMCEKTVKSAIKELGVVSKKGEGKDAPWTMRLPTAPNPLPG
jgi:putative DNA primase/helicase